jgi:AcrR family transcriptional regulator
VVKINKTLRRRANLRDALIDAAEKSIATEGLKGLRARQLAFEVGCAVGAIYNVVSDIDDLIVAVNERTLQMLEAELSKAVEGAGQGAHTPDAGLKRLEGLALAYLDFAVEHGQRWRALFEHSMAQGAEVPAWYRTRQQRMFGYLDQALAEVAPKLPAARRSNTARALFSAVHGVVALGLDEKLGGIALADLRSHLTFHVRTFAHGLMQAG